MCAATIKIARLLSLLIDYVAGKKQTRQGNFEAVPAKRRIKVQKSWMMRICNLDGIYSQNGKPNYIGGIVPLLPSPHMVAGDRENSTACYGDILQIV
jgi:hypothetical protein